MSNTRQLSLDEIKKCLVSWREHQDKDAATILVQCYDSLIKYIAHRYKHCGLLFDELVSSGYFGLWKGINQFDYQNREMKGFSTYVGTAIENQMIDDVRVSKRQAGNISLYTTITNEKKNITSFIFDILSNHTDDTFDGTYENMRMDIVNTALSFLTDREKQVILMHYGFYGDTMTHEQIGQVLGYSKGNITSIKKRALSKISNTQNMEQVRSLVN